MCGSSKTEGAIKAYEVKLAMPGVAASHSALFAQGYNRGVPAQNFFLQMALKPPDPLA